MINVTREANLGSFNKLPLVYSRTQVGVARADGSVSLQHNQISQSPAVGETHSPQRTRRQETAYRQMIVVSDGVAKACSSSGKPKRGWVFVADLCGLGVLPGEAVFSG